MKIKNLALQAKSLWPLEVEPTLDISSNMLKIYCDNEQTPQVCDWLFTQLEYHFAGLIVKENSLCELCYLFVGEKTKGYVEVITDALFDTKSFNSISSLVHAADWYEREAEDLYGVYFKNHPRLGDFILHDDVWQEDVKPMRKNFDPKTALLNRKPKEHWHPRKIVDESGAFIMTVGPIFSGEAESVNLQLETIGEEIIRAFPRLFFKYRGIEKIAEGLLVNDVLLLTERTAGTTAFSHALAFCLTIERLSDAKIPKRAQMLRIFFAEIERLRSHIGILETICNSTGLVVAANQVAILEEKMLRLSSVLAKHRYLFGLVIPGGLSCDISQSLCQEAVIEIKKNIEQLDGIELLLINTSSFLDRLEEVGIITHTQAKTHGLVGPMARGSNCLNDLRRFQPYLNYDEFEFEIPCEEEGDGYARLRVLFAEARESAKIIEQVVSAMPEGEIFSKGNIKAGTALCGVETPRGATWHQIQIDENRKIEKYRLLMPSFTNWHGFHVAIESFAFQDLPIILATLGLSVAENDK